MYLARTMAELTPAARVLARDGLVMLPDIYTVNDLAELNAAMNTLFASRQDQKRSYVRPDDMMALGILDLVLSPAMLDVLFTIMPDPVLYHLHAYEIEAGCSQPHIFANQPGGWHRDMDSAYFRDDPTHVSVFVYLSDVGPDDGVFEFASQEPEAALMRGAPAMSLTGSAGLAFAWHRSFYHRAAPNRGPRRRRLLKISIQRNEFPSVLMEKDYVRRMLAEVPAGNPKLDVLLGRLQGLAAPHQAASRMIAPVRVQPMATVDVTQAAPGSVDGSGAGLPYD